VEVERSIIRYDYNDFFKLSFGRTHAHRLLEYRVPSRRLAADHYQPSGLVRVGGTFIPVHFVGLLAEGYSIRAAGSATTWRWQRPRPSSAVLGPGDNNNNRAWSPTFIAPPALWTAMGVRSTATKSLPVVSPREMNFANGFRAAHCWTKENRIPAEFANVITRIF